MQQENSTLSFNFHQALSEQTGQAYFAFDTGSKQFTYFSPAFEKAFKVKQGDFSNPKSLLALIHPEDRDYVVGRHKELLAGSTVGAFEFRIQFPSQAEQWICLTPSLFQEAPERLLLIGHAENITAQKRSNDVLIRYSNKKNAILSILSHDLAGPLVNIQKMASLLAEETTVKDNEKSHHIIDLIGRSSKQASQLIQDFINQEFLESSEVEIIKRRVNLVEKLKEPIRVYQDAQNGMIAKTVRFSSAKDEVYVQVDDNKFIQVVNNLLSNAMKFTPDGGVITVGIEEREETVIVTVEDNGVGIPDKYHATLFEKFTPARRLGLKGEASTGLGMSIIKTIVEWHSGRIWFDSEEGRGTTFYIELPKE